MELSLIQAMRLLHVLATIFGFVVVITVQGFLRTAISTYLGDDTAKSEGFLTLNPAMHVNPLVTIGLLLMTIFMFLFTKADNSNVLMVLLVVMFVFGASWRTTIPMNIYNFKNPEKDLALMGILEFLVYFAFSWFIFLVYNIIGSSGLLSVKAAVIMKTLLIPVAIINLYSAILQFIPTPMSSGYFILNYYWPAAADAIDNIDPFVLLIIVLVIVYFTSWLQWIFDILALICAKLAGL